MVSQINYTEHKESSSAQKVDAGISTSAPILSKFLKIDVSGGLSHEGNKGENENVIKEKVHTNVSLLSKFRGFLVENKILKSDLNFQKYEWEILLKSRVNCKKSDNKLYGQFY